MKKLTYNQSAKIIAAILLSVTLVVGVGLSLLAGVLSEYGMYSMSKDSFEKYYTQRNVQYLVDSQWQKHFHWAADQPEYNWYDDKRVDTDIEGIDIIVKDPNGVEVYSTYDSSREYAGEYDFAEDTSEHNLYEVKAYLQKEPPQGSIVEQILRIGMSAYDSRVLVIILAVLNVLASVVLFVLLMIAAGRREGEEGVHLRFVDKGLIDVYWVAVVSAISIMWLISIEVFASLTVAGIVACVVSAILSVILCTMWCMSASVQIKNRTIIRNSLVGRCCKLVWRAVRFIWSVIVDIIRAVPFTWKTLLIATVVIGINFIAVASGAIGFVVIESIIILLFVAYSTMNIDALDKAAEKLANGEIGQKINLSHMFGVIKRRGENLNSIDEAVSKAVEEKMKSERFKTELITNVSHDIKTPLTSIINYTDLLKQHLEDSDDETAREYVEIISNNSQRLKKLTSDIVEASKASTGAVDVELADLDYGMLVEQCVSEYDDRLKAAKLSVVANVAEDVGIRADSRLMWRIIDNILSNICKYAMEGTRVYIDVYEEGDRAVAEFKNISSTELNITPEEMMERFVRGDASRNTDGSGLGLSIADNLARLQDGELKLGIDGDLFKARLEFSTRECVE